MGCLLLVFVLVRADWFVRCAALLFSFFARCVFSIALFWLFYLFC